MADRAQASSPLRADSTSVRRFRDRAASRRPVVLAAIAIGLTTATILGPLPASAQNQDPRVIEELRRAIEQRDAAIADLLRRVEQLERAAASETDVAGGIPPTTPPPVPPEPVSQQVEPPEDDAAATQTAPSPGQFEVDDEAAIERALERTLVQAGALLLPMGTIEVEPDFTYVRRETDAPVFLTADGQQLLASDEVRRDTLRTDLLFRIGLPFDSQLELNIPYVYEDESTVTEVRFAERLEQTRRGSGFGDVSIALTKALLREGPIQPDLFASLLWDSSTGGSDEGLEFGSGFDEVGASLTAVKRIDPLVWVAGLSYLHAFEDDNVRPGSEIGLSLGTVLAVSPYSSLRFFVNQTFIDEIDLNGSDVQGSDQVVSTLTIGASSVLSRRLLVDVQAGVGLTEDAPDYFFRVSLPIRFNLF